jgi:hypothetical protein
MRLALAAAGLAIGTLVGGTLVGSVAAQAASYNLTGDYSNTANPNGAWSYNYAGSPLAHQTGPSSANPLNPAIPAGGYFSTGSDLNSNTPDVLKAAVNGSAAGGQDTDFLANDIIIHSPNDGTALTISWKAPTAGTITNLAAAVWYAHSAVTRSNDVKLSLANVVLQSWTVSNGSNGNRNSPGTYANAGPLSVNAGELLTLSFTMTALQPFGSLNGARLSFNFESTVPIPAALPLFMSALVGLGFVAHRRRQAAA